MDLISLPQLSEAALLERSVAEKVILGIKLIVTCLHEACETVADDTSIDRYDDSTSEGQLRWRRCRNRVCHALDDHLVAGLEDVIADISDNALVVPVDGCLLSFYSARNGIDQPDLSGASKTKNRVVNEMQLQLQGLGPPEPPSRLVVVYDSDDHGLTHAAVGMLETSTQWHWCVTTYERHGLTVGEHRGEATSPLAYDEQPEVILPEIELSDDLAAQELPAYDKQPDPEMPDMGMLEDADNGDGEQGEAGSGETN
jgi:hypothetical protein